MPPAESTPAPMVIATLGGQPQVITLLLDGLLARGIRCAQVHVLHLDLRVPRYVAALNCLAAEFRGGRYAGAACSLRPHPVRYQGRPVAALDSQEAVAGARATSDALFERIKAAGHSVHLSLSGGPRLLGYMTLAMAQLHFHEDDVVWHILSTDAVRDATRDGRQMHVPGNDGVTLIQVPLPPGYEGLRRMGRRILGQSDEERERCQRVWEQLSPAQRQVLRAFAADHLVPGTIEGRLGLSTSTINSHKTAILRLSANEWPEEALIRPRLDYHWLRDHFAPFFRILDIAPE